MFDIPLHVLVVHFPIALIVVAVIYDTRGYFSGTPELHDTGYSLVLWATAGAALAAGTGLQLAGGLSASGAIAHAGLGLFGTIALIALTVLRYSARARETEAAASYPLLWLILEFAAALAIVLAAVTGHRAVLQL